MATQITPEQMTQLENHPRHRDIAKQWVKDIATYFRGLTSGDETWAKKRIIAAGIAHHPNSQDYSEWIAQMTATLKGQVVWDTDLDTTVDFLESNNKYEEMSNLIFTLRASRVEF